MMKTLSFSAVAALARPWPVKEMATWVRGRLRAAGVRYRVFASGERSLVVLVDDLKRARDVLGVLASRDPRLANLVWVTPDGVSPVARAEIRDGRAGVALYPPPDGAERRGWVAAVTAAVRLGRLEE